MRKSDVTTRHEHGYRVPVVNVKHYGPTRTRDPYCAALAALVVEDHGYPEIPGLPFTAWIASIDDRNSDTFWRFTLTDGWKRLDELACEIWRNKGVHVVSYGRSGGWASVTFGGDARRVPDVQAWAAIDLARWARFCKGARAIVGDLEYQYLASLFAGPYSDAYADWAEARKGKRDAEIFRGYASASCVG